MRSCSSQKAGTEWQVPPAHSPAVPGHFFSLLIDRVHQIQKLEAESIKTALEAEPRPVRDRSAGSHPQSQAAKDSVHCLTQNMGGLTDRGRPGG